MRKLQHVFRRQRKKYVSYIPPQQRKYKFVRHALKTYQTEFKGFTLINSPTWVTDTNVVCFSPHPDDTSIRYVAQAALPRTFNQ